MYREETMNKQYSILKNILNRIEGKNSWGKNELKNMILDEIILVETEDD